MQTYSDAMKANMIRRMLGPRKESATALAKTVGISQNTLSRWLRDASGKVDVMSKPQAPPAPQIPRRPEDWSAEERLRVVVAAAGLTESAIGELLRREGLHETTLLEWRAAALEGISPRKASRAEQKRIARLERELVRKDKALAEAAALLILQKKIRVLWGAEDDDTDPRSDE